MSMLLSDCPLMISTIRIRLRCFNPLHLQRKVHLIWPTCLPEQTSQSSPRNLRPLHSISSLKSWTECNKQSREKVRIETYKKLLDIYFSKDRIHKIEYFCTAFNPPKLSCLNFRSILLFKENIKRLILFAKWISKSNDFRAKWYNGTKLSRSKSRMFPFTILDLKIIVRIQLHLCLIY